MILFISSIYEDDEINYYRNNSKIALAESSNSHQNWIIRGLRLKKETYLINSPANGTYPKYFKKAIIHSKCREQSVRIGYVNLPIIKQLQKSIAIFKEVRKMSKNKIIEYIIVYMPYLPTLLPICIYKMIKANIKILLIVPDLPEYFNTSKRKLVIKTAIKKIENFIIKKLLKYIDTFVLLTIHMAGKFNIVKPYIIQEGIIGENDILPSDEIEMTLLDSLKDCVTITYTGTLKKKYGIINLLDAFGMIQKNNYRLIICGAGEASEGIQKKAQKDQRIIFLGQVNHETAMHIQAKSTVLVNPRTPEEEYTKYSFPSKTMEYLVSGRPVIAYRLDGIPDEYDKYVIYVNGNTSIDLKLKLEEVCGKTSEELNQIGKKAREYVLKEKNFIKQAEKMLELMDLL